MKLIAFVLINTLLLGCGRGYKLSELYIQKIKDSDKSIIDYGAWSDLNDGSKYGRTILDAHESIEMIEAEDMPKGFFSKLPTKDSLFLIQLKEGGNRIPKYLSTDFSLFKGFVVKTDYYAYEVGTYNRLTYKFSDFKETSDSLIILGIEKDFDDLPTSKNELGFKTGNIKLIEADSSGKLKRIEILAFFMNGATTMEVDKLHVIKNDLRYITGSVNFHFEPTKNIFTNQFSDLGIFKKRKIKNATMLQ